MSLFLFFFSKVTIVPRGNGALGYAQSMPSELHLYREEQLLDMMKMTLGGRAAEQVFFGKVSSGASDDLKKISQLAHAQVMQFGMSPRLLNISFDIESENNFTKNYSEATQIIIDSEVSRIIDESYAATLKLTEEKRVLIDALAQRLLKEETINHDVLVEVLGDRKYGNASYREYVENTKKGGFGSMELKTAAAGMPSPPLFLCVLCVSSFYLLLLLCLFVLSVYLASFVLFALTLPRCFFSLDSQLPLLPPPRFPAMLCSGLPRLLSLLLLLLKNILKL